jgi:hypothetical protein
MFEQRLRVNGRHAIEHRDSERGLMGLAPNVLRSEVGNLKGIYEFPNGIVDVGMNHLLDVTFGGSSQVGTWYIGLIDNSGFSTFSDSDTLSSHAGWTEFTNYTEANRVTWADDAASSRSKSNSTTADYSINASGNLKGIFVSSNSTKSTGNTGTLWSTAAFSSVVATSNGDTLKVTYTISG